MWDSPPYAINMFYYIWLIKTLLRSIAGQDLARLEEKYRESMQSQGDAMCLVKETDIPEHLPVGHGRMVIHQLIEMG